MGEPRETDRDGIEDLLSKLIKPQITDTDRIEIVFDHLVNLTDQVARLAVIVRAAGLHVPDFIGTLGPATEETVRRLTEESIKRHFPDQTKGGV